LVILTCPVSVSTSTSAPSRHHPERRDVRALAGAGRGRRVVRLEDARADDVAGLHAVALLEQVGDRDVGAFRLADLLGQRLELVAGVLRARRTAWPMWNSEREPSVPMS
jgi:hypothetical protein